MRGLGTSTCPPRWTCTPSRGHSHLPPALIPSPATSVTCPHLADLGARWATWEERCGEAEEACRVLEGLEAHHPGLVSVTLHK